MSWQTIAEGPAKEERQLSRILHGSLTEVHGDLEEANGAGAGVFVCVNETDGGGRKVENVKRVRALFCDFDGPGGETKVRPSIITMTGRGKHFYWLTDDVLLEQFTPLQEELAAIHGSDPSVKDLPRVMRVPGFEWCKETERRPVKLLHVERGATWHHHDLMARLRAARDAHDRDALLARVEQYMRATPPAISGEGGDLLTYRVCCIQHDFGLTDAEFWPLLKAWNNTCVPPWDDDDLRRKMDNAQRYHRKEDGHKVDGVAPASVPGLAVKESKEELEDRLKPIPAHEAVRRWNTERPPAVVATGIESLDAPIGGGVPVGQVAVVIGYTGAGKSDLVRQIRRFVSERGHGVVHVDVELGWRTVTHRDISQESEVPSVLLRDPDFLSEMQLEALHVASERVAARPWQMICPGAGVELSALQEAIRGALDGLGDPEKPRVVILDSIQRLAPGARGENQREKVQNFVWWCCYLAQRERVAVICTSEQNRQFDSTQPSVDAVLRSGAESRALEFGPDVVIGMVPQRVQDEPEAQDANAEYTRLISLCIAKTREGSTGYIKKNLAFTGPCWSMSEEVKLSNSHLKILDALEEAFPEGMSGSEVARVAKVRKQVALESLRTLLEQGVVRSQPQAGGRSTVWLLTPPDSSENREPLT